MSRVCQICDRGPTIGIRKSHSNIKTKKRVFPNLQTRKINGNKVLICTRCIKNQNKVK